MALIDVVKYQSNENEFVGKFPSQNLRLGTQVVVNTSQRAFFVKGGQILDEFEQGTHTITTGNIPFLTTVISLPFGGDTPFQAEVWYVNLISKLDNKWGTPIPIQIEDPKYNVIVPVRAFGQFGLSIENPRKFLESLVGNLTDFSCQKVIEYFKGKIVTSITTAISKKIIIDGISVLQISVFLDDISSFCAQKVAEEFNKYGIKIENFYIMSINIPEDDPSIIKLKQAKDLAAKVSIIGRDVYQADRSFDVLEKAANNPGGNMGDMMNTGIGLGLGLGIGSKVGNIANNMNTFPVNAPAPPPPPPQVEYHILINNQPNGPFAINKLKELAGAGTLTKETLVWKAGMEKWEEAKLQSDLAGIFQQLPPPPPPIPSTPNQT